MACLPTSSGRVACAGRAERPRLGVVGAVARGSRGVADPAGGAAGQRSGGGRLGCVSGGRVAQEPAGGAGALFGRELAAGAAAQSAGVGVVGVEWLLGAGLAAAGAVGLVAVAGVGRGLAAAASAGVVARAEWTLWQGQRLLLVGYLGRALHAQSQGSWGAGCLGLGCVVCERDEPWVQVERQVDGRYQATLCGHFTLTVLGDHPFRMRLLVLFLSLLDVPGAERGSRRTRMGARPSCRQLQLAWWFGVPQPDISRWLKYWQAADWAELAQPAQCRGADDRIGRGIVEACATFPSWGVVRVYQHLRQQGVVVTEPQVQQAVAQSGWRHSQQTLAERYDLSGPALCLREGWLVGQLLVQVRELLGHLEAGQALPAEVRITLADLTALAQEAARAPQRRSRPCPGCYGSSSRCLGSGNWSRTARYAVPTAAQTRSGARAPRRA